MEDLFLKFKKKKNFSNVPALCNDSHQFLLNELEKSAGDKQIGKCRCACIRTAMDCIHNVQV